MSERKPQLKKQILFVDDEPKLLQGLKRMLRPLCHDWTMAFVSSGKEALELLSKEHFDVLVTAIRMPEMDGIQLLEEIKKCHPHIIRIVLSGTTERELLLKSSRLSHQFLTKPCDPYTLKSTISRTCEVFDLVQNETIKRVVSQMDMLPSLPSLYLAIVEELNSKQASLQKVGKIIAQDLAMTAKTLQLVNSSFFGFLRHISSPLQAANLLGLDTIKSLVLTIQVFSQFDSKKLPGFFLDHLSKHSIETGLFAKTIAEKEGLDSAAVDHAFLAGLMHDTGQLVLAANFPEKYGKVLFGVKEENISILEGESHLFGTTHPEVGAYLMGLWGLPMPIVEAIAFHHVPSQCVDQRLSPLTAVHVANAMVNQKYPTVHQESDYQFDNYYLSTLNLTDKLSEWQKIYSGFQNKGESDNV